MKVVYKIYDITYSSIHDQESMLNAFTDDKKTFKEYMSLRDKRKFRIEKCEMSKDEWVCFANRNRLQMIEYKELTTIDKDEYTCRECMVPITASQYSLISDAERMFGMECGQMHPLKLFKKKYRDALRSLEYDVVYDLANSIDPDAMPSFQLDEVQIYVNMCIEEFK